MTQSNDPHEAEPPELKPAHRARFSRIAAELNRLLGDIRDEIPDANLYIEDSGNFILLSGDSHEEGPGGRMVARQDRTLAIEQVPYSGGGGW